MDTKITKKDIKNSIQDGACNFIVDAWNACALLYDVCDRAMDPVADRIAVGLVKASDRVGRTLEA